MTAIGRHITVLNLSIGWVAIWGIWILDPWHQMFSENQLLYAPMSSICSNEIVWGAGFLSVCIVAVYLQKTKHPHRASLVIAIMAMALSMLFFLGDATRPAPALFLLTTIFNLIQWREPHWNHSQS